MPLGHFSQKKVPSPTGKNNGCVDRITCILQLFENSELRRIPCCQTMSIPRAAGSCSVWKKQPPSHSTNRARLYICGRFQCRWHQENASKISLENEISGGVLRVGIMLVFNDGGVGSPPPAIVKNRSHRAKHPPPYAMGPKLKTGSV